MIWEDSQFQKFASEKFNENYPKYAPYEPSEALARNFIYRSCNIKLASEDIENNKIFKELMKRYKEWSEK